MASVYDLAYDKNGVYSWEEIEKHNKESDCWIVIKDVVYNVTEWLNEHPGGREVILAEAGADATDAFEAIDFHTSSRTLGFLEDTRIGRVAKKGETTTDPKAAMAKKVVLKEAGTAGTSPLVYVAVAVVGLAAAAGVDARRMAGPRWKLPRESATSKENCSFLCSRSKVQSG